MEKISPEKMKELGAHPPPEKERIRRAEKRKAELFESKMPRVFKGSKPPGTLELALLAGILTLRTGNTDSPEAAVFEAMKFWGAAEGAIIVRQELTEVLRGLFDMEEGEWERRIREFSGDKTYLFQLLNGEGNDAPRYQFEGEVLPNLFTANNETEDSRKEKLGELLGFAQKQGYDTRLFFKYRSGRRHDPPPLLTAENLLGKSLNIRQARWLAQARMAQLSVKKGAGRKKKARKPEAN